LFRRKLLGLSALALVCGAGALLLAATGTARSGSAASPAPSDSLVRQIDRYRTVTWRWERVMSRRPTRGSSSYRTDPSLRYRRWVRDLWRTRAVRARRQALHPPYRSAWLCIHRYEASWRDGGAPYYGGLQMDISFQAHYAPALLRRKGTADHWTPLEQIWAAERARRSGLGFTPWPSTARLCGVL
jgi:hypothetical protein